MIEAYKIAVNMNMKGDAHKKMTQFADSVKKASDQIDKLHRLLPYINSEFANIEKRLRAINPQMKMFSRSIFGLGSESRRASSSMSYLSQSMIGTEGNTRRLKYQTDTLRNSMNSLASASRNARAGINSVGRGRTGGGGRGAASGGMGGLALALGSRAFGVAGGAYGVYREGKKGFQSYSDYIGGTAKIQAMGYGQDVVNQAIGATGSKPGMSANVQMESYIAALMATQSPERAANLAPILSQGQLGAQRVFGGRFTHKQSEDAIRAAEILGGGDEGKIASALSDVFKLVSLSGGTIQPSQIRQLVRKNPNLTSMGLLHLEPTVQELGGDVTATGLRTGMAQLVKGQMGKQQAETLKSYGWLGPVSYDKNGRPIGSKFGDFKHSNIAFSDPEAFLRKIVMPTYAERGYKSQEDISKHLYFDFARTYADVLNVILKNLPKSQLIEQRANQIPGIGGLNKLGPDEGKAVQRFSESLTSFNTALGKMISPGVIQGLNILSFTLEKTASVLNYISDEHTKYSPNNKIAQGFGSIVGVTDQPGSIRSGGKPYIAKVEIDGKKAGTALVKHFSGNQMVENGQTSVNLPLSGASNAYNGNSGTFSQ